MVKFEMNGAGWNLNHSIKYSILIVLLTHFITGVTKFVKLGFQYNKITFAARIREEQGDLINDSTSLN
jgi:hypothetical protein